MNGTEIAIGLDGDLLLNSSGNLEVAHNIDLLRQDLLHVLYEMPPNFIIGQRTSRVAQIEREVRAWIRNRLPLRNPIDPGKIDVELKYKYPNRKEHMHLKIYLTVPFLDTPQLLLPALYWSAAYGIYPIGIPISYDITMEDNLRSINPNDPSTIGAVLQERELIKGYLRASVDFPLIPNVQRELTNMLYSAGGEVLDNNTFVSKGELQLTNPKTPGNLVNDALKETFSIEDALYSSSFNDKLMRDGEKSDVTSTSSFVMQEVLKKAHKSTPEYEIESFEEVISVGVLKDVKWVGDPTNKLPISYEPANNIYIIDTLKQDVIQADENYNYETFNDLDDLRASRLWVLRDIMMVMREKLSANHLQRFGMVSPISGLTMKEAINYAIRQLNRLIGSDVRRVYYRELLSFIGYDFLTFISQTRSVDYINYYAFFLPGGSPPIGNYFTPNLVNLPYERFQELRATMLRSGMFDDDNPNLKITVDYVYRLCKMLKNGVETEKGMTPGPERQRDAIQTSTLETKELSRLIDLPRPGTYSVLDILLGNVSGINISNAIIHDVELTPIADSSSNHYADFQFVTSYKGKYDFSNVTDDKIITLSQDNKNITVFPTVYVPTHTQTQRDKTGNPIVNASGRPKLHFLQIAANIRIRYTKAIARSVTRNRMVLSESKIFPMQRNTAKWEAVFEESLPPGQYVVHYDRYMIAENEAIEPTREYSYANII